MKALSVLVVGSGGREHALAWKLNQSPRVQAVFIAPGNAGSATVGTNVPIKDNDIEALVAFGQEKRIDLTVVGPEVPLAAGIVDRFTAVGLPIFGPSQAAAQLESSKAFAKSFMADEGIPTAASATFTDYEEARAYLTRQPGPVVVKASGLAAGKGVIVCDHEDEAVSALQQIMIDRAFGNAGNEVVIEERLRGPEVSLLAFSDGRTVVPMLPARDHKRVFDNDEGPNTGGMGAFAPPPDVDQTLVDEVMRSVLEAAVKGMAARGTPYVGVLYAGLMLTEDGPKVLEFNCRFGDPETQVILPMLASDLAEIMLACVEGRLAPDMVQRRDGACATVVMAAPGYPGSYPKGLPISGVTGVAAGAGNVPAQDDLMVFHAGTRQVAGRLLTSGGRVLAVSALGSDLETAVNRAYEGVGQIHFEGAHYRQDIGGDWRLETRDSQSPISNLQSPSAYAQAGVDLNAGNRATSLMKAAVQATFGPEVLSDVGAFGGLFDISRLKGMRSPVLVASTDGVGTKTKVAAAVGRWDSIGQDIVNHCVNDILAQGARPLFFLDYIAASRLDPEQIATIVGGVALACSQAGCALLGGETAEMPGVYEAGEIDLVGTVVGVVERAEIIDGRGIQKGDVILGLPASGLHTNGYSLARHVLTALDWTAIVPELGTSIGEALLIPHRSYLPHIQQLQKAGVDIHGLSHITGGGLIDNPPRILPQGLAAHLQRGTWPEPPLFGYIQELGNIDTHEMCHVFNMGLGMLVIVPPEQAANAQTVLGEGVFVVGEIIAGQRTVEIED